MITANYDEFSQLQLCHIAFNSITFYKPTGIDVKQAHHTSASSGRYRLPQNSTPPHAASTKSWIAATSKSYPPHEAQISHQENP
jgi:hypothetical protein